jgi:hypothetical protein
VRRVVSRVVDPDRIRIQSGQIGIRIRIQEGKNDPQKKEKNLKVYVLSVGWPLLRAEGFFCNLNVLYGGIGISKL